MYTFDNGSNAGWGSPPVGEGPGGNATNDPVGSNNPSFGDGLHFITGPGYYGGHPNPTRSNPANTFNASNPQSPVSVANPIESDFRGSNENGALVVFNHSTNGIAEYTAANFGGAMQGDLLAAGYNNTIQRIKLNAAGNAVVLAETLFNNVGGLPIDVTTPVGALTGTIWAADLARERSLFSSRPMVSAERKEIVTVTAIRTLTKTPPVLTRSMEPMSRPTTTETVSPTLPIPTTTATILPTWLMPLRLTPPMETTHRCTRLYGWENDEPTRAGCWAWASPEP